MNAAPKGKIGRLPRAIQEQINRRLEHGEQAWTLVAWLNAQPEVSAVLAAEFAGQPIREQNSAFQLQTVHPDCPQYRRLPSLRYRSFPCLRGMEMSGTHYLPILCR